MGTPLSRPALRRWLFWFVVLAASTAVLLPLRARLDKAHVALTFLLVVLGGSSAAGRALGLSLAATAFVTFNFFFLPPYNTLVITDPFDWLVLFAFLVTSSVAAQLFEQQRREAERARRRADELDRLATLGAETLNAPRAEDALDAIAAVIRDAMLTERCEIFLRAENDELRLAGEAPAAGGAGQRSGLLNYTVERDEAAVERADGTLSLVPDALSMINSGEGDLLPLADLRALGIPLRVRGRIVGALRLTAPRPFTLTSDQRRVLLALAYYAALGAERVRLAAAEEVTESLRQADRLKDALLAAVSHDLRTPLTAIKGIANEIWHGGDPGRAQIIEQEADRLNEMVHDLLELSQLNAGGLRLSIALNTVDDVVGAALERIEAVHGVGRVEVNLVSDGAILVGRFDFARTMRALTNLLDNALKYSPKDTVVVVRGWHAGSRVRIAVEDRGPGVSPGEETRIFEPFFRGTRSADVVRGTGLGLSIARQVTEAQGGTLTYEPRAGGGSRFVLDLPAGALPPE